MKESIALFWFRRDLRLEDNHGLFRALSSGKRVMPIFIFDPCILDELPKDDHRVSFIWEQLKRMSAQWLEKGTGIQVYYGAVETVFEQISSTYSIGEIHTNRDYEPYARQRDEKIARWAEAKGIAFHTHQDQVIFEPNQVVKSDGTPYLVYTPFSKAWLSKREQTTLEVYPSEENLHQGLALKEQMVDLAQMGFKPSIIQAPHALTEDQRIADYAQTRNFPFLNATTKVGVHLRFGTISVRSLVRKALVSEENTYLKELIWREFMMMLLWHFPHTVQNSYKPVFDRIAWRNNQEEFAAWCQGKTGYPLVDAGMRELNATGFMHNRVRMLVGSFLVKHLLIDWRWGEAYFAQKLFDFELSSNVGNWQWVAGSGIDAAPYFRIFNPEEQIKKFDQDHKYIRRWVPEYQEFTYPKPIVDHKMARERFLQAHKAAASILN